MAPGQHSKKYWSCSQREKDILKRRHDIQQSDTKKNDIPQINTRHKSVTTMFVLSKKTSFAVGFVTTVKYTSKIFTTWPPERQ